MLSAAGFTFANLIAGFIFSGIGFVAFVYGKKEGSFKPLSIGIALMAYPYFFNKYFLVVCGRYRFMPAVVFLAGLTIIKLNK